MKKFKDAKKVGLRSKETGELIAIYPHNIRPTDQETEKAVKDWYYQTSCGAEDELLYSYVDVVTDDEIKLRNL
ncbi:MAG: hypothetical protein RIN55_09490 [Tissierellaceae bacterium]|nr:hypothetical protein [Tissierellaceae bacterium]